MVPVLVIGRTAIFESIAIMEYANDLCGGALLPQDPVARARARSIVAWQHAGLSNICHRISFESAFYPAKRQLTESENADCDRLFSVLENTLEESGGAWLFGSLSLADLMLTPSVVRLSRHLPQASKWPNVDRWMKALLCRPSVTEWLAEADRLPPIWLDEYLVPGCDIPVELTRGA